MALLHAFAAHRRDDLSAVATFDHGTGHAASRAVELVVRECLGRGLTVVAGRAADRPDGRRTEAAWREARWSFLRAVADDRRATIVTAHTADDQVETVAMRILRGASARGLAGMAVRTAGVERPLLGITRAMLTDYAARAGVPFIDDPSNDNRAHLRNRLRLELLPAFEAARPGFLRALLDLAERSAAWRHALAVLADPLAVHTDAGTLAVDAAALADLTTDGLASLWPELAARAGVVLDRRGAARLAEWSARAHPGQRMPLSGGAVVERTARTFVVRAKVRAER